MKEIPFIVPSNEEQIKIVAYIKAEHKKLDISISKLKKQVSLLKEYRTRLISDVVTGQIDVRNVAIPEYEVETEVIENNDEEGDFDE